MDVRGGRFGDGRMSVSRGVRAELERLLKELERARADGNLARISETRVKLRGVAWNALEGLLADLTAAEERAAEAERERDEAIDMYSAYSDLTVDEARRNVSILAVLSGEPTKGGT